MKKENKVKTPDKQDENKNSRLNYAGKLKLKSIFSVLKYVLYFLASSLCLFGVGYILWYCFSMSAGIDLPEYGRYHFLDRDLWITIPACLFVSALATSCTNFKYRILSILFLIFYFAILIITLEYWNYSNIEHFSYYRTTTEQILGGVSFGIFFVLVPVLLWIHNHIEKNKTPETEIEEQTENNETA
jgi:magnesium-transporting ATPase (P-type)